MNKGGFFFWLAGMMLGSFLFVSPILAESPRVVITEIGAYEATDHEWIEIYNRSSEPIDLFGWKFFEANTHHGIAVFQGQSILSPGAYAIIAQKADVFMADYPNAEITIFDSAWSSLNESGEEIGLKDAVGNTVELFFYVAAPDYSLQRVDVSTDVYSVENWKEHDSDNTAGRQNEFVTEYPPDDAIPDEPMVSENPASAFDPSTIIMSELVVNPLSGENEWIELYNASTTPIDMTGFVLMDGVGTVATPTTSIDAFGFIVIELSISKFNNGGDQISLLFEDTVLSSLAYGDWDNENGEENVDTPEAGQSIAWQAGSFVLTTTPTKGFENVITMPEIPIETDSEIPPLDVLDGEDTQSPGTVDDTRRTYTAGSIVVNEFVSDPTDGSVEFIELFNTTGASIDLIGWKLLDGSEAVTSLMGSIMPAGYEVIEKPKGNLNNAGDIIVLMTPNDQEMDRVAYGSWDDSNIADNAPAAKDPYGVARRTDGVDTDNDTRDFVETLTVTPGAANVVDSGMTDTNVEGEAVIISEVYPNPPGSDSKDEFIELYNSGLGAVDITGWTLGDSTVRRFMLSGVIHPGEYRAFPRSETKISLNNSGNERVALYHLAEKPVSDIEYSGATPESQSFAFSIEDTWVWTTTPTPDKENIITGTAAAPIITVHAPAVAALGEAVTFDASDTTDPNGDDITFFWVLNDQTFEGDVWMHTFTDPGDVTVLCTAMDSTGAVSKQTIIVSIAPSRDIESASLAQDTPIIISEIFPNPIGSDLGEFIELFNPAASDVPLFGFMLDDADGGSRPYKFKEDMTIGAQSFLVVSREQTGLSLNNTFDDVRLLFEDGTVLFEMHYDEVVEGASYIQDENGQWLWTLTPTPGEMNTLQEIDAKEISKSTKKFTQTNISELADFDPGDMIEVEGVVLATPNTFATQYLYVGELDAAGIVTAGVQVYMYKKDFPNVFVGTRVLVRGELAESGMGIRIKVTGKEEMEITGTGEKPAPALFDIAQMDAGAVGKLISVTGTVTDVKTSYMYVDDGTEEIKVYFKKGAGIAKGAVHIGDSVQVIGIVQITGDSLQILPRFLEDIIVQQAATEFVTELKEGEPPREREMAEKYLTATAGGVTSILFGLLAKMHGSTALRAGKRVVSLIIKRQG